MVVFDKARLIIGLIQKDSGKTHTHTHHKKKEQKKKRFVICYIAFVNLAIACSLPAVISVDKGPRSESVSYE